MKTYKSVIRSLLADGYQIAVMDGEEGENLLKPSSKYADIVEHVESMDITSVEVFDPSAKKLIDKPRVGESGAGAILYSNRYGMPMIGWINIILDNDNEDDFEDCQDYSGKVIESTFIKLGGK
jgi:hypothetical protein